MNIYVLLYVIVIWLKIVSILPKLYSYNSPGKKVNLYYLSSEYINCYQKYQLFAVLIIGSTILIFFTIFLYFLCKVEIFNCRFRVHCTGL